MIAGILLLALGCTPAASEPPLDGRDGRELLLDRFRPESMLKVEKHELPRAGLPVVDVHVHPRIRFHHSEQQLDEFVALMDDQNIRVCVSLDGGLGDKLDEHMKYLWTKHRDRFVIFANVDWQGAGRDDDWSSWDCHRPDFARRTAMQLAEAKKAGASGLKVFKDFGLRYRNPDGSLVKIDDERFFPIWEACGNLGMPVIIHVADPAAFFLPVDEKNERWEELHRHPEWSFYGGDNPKRDDLFAAFMRVLTKHPQTTFIGAHVADNPEDLATVGRWLDEHPNLVVEIASRTNELGRQPRTAREFFLKYADRIMFGTDGPRERGRLLPYWRFLETHDEYFPYAENPFPPQGFWHISGIGLPEDVLRKVYHANAERVIPGVAVRVKRVTD